MRTIALLKQIAESGNTFTIAQLSGKASLPPSSVHRLLQPLIKEGFVERGPSQSYRIGSELLRIASLVLRQVDAAVLARPILRRLWTEWEETSSLAVYKPTSRNAVVVEIIQTPHPLRFVIEPFTELSLTWGSLGRAILASLPPAEAEDAMRSPAAGPLSGQPPLTRAAMGEIIAEIQAQGFAQYRNEQVDAAGVAAPVFRADGSVLGSIGITAPAQRLRKELVPAMAKAVQAAAAELSATLGYGPP